MDTAEIVQDGVDCGNCGWHGDEESVILNTKINALCCPECGKENLYRKWKFKDEHNIIS